MMSTILCNIFNSNHQHSLIFKSTLSYIIYRGLETHPYLTFLLDIISPWKKIIFHYTVSNMELLKLFISFKYKSNNNITFFYLRLCQLIGSQVVSFTKQISILMFWQHLVDFPFSPFHHTILPFLDPII